MSLVFLFLALVGYLYTGVPGHRGLDVSHHQGKIDWKKVAYTGDVEFVFIKATQGLKFVDQAYRTNHDEARQYGIRVGAYHFFEANKSGRKQFEHFYDVVGNDIDLLPVLDLEEGGGKITDLTAYHAEVKAFVDACRNYYGRYPILYTSLSFIKDYRLQPFLEQCPLWLAWYTRVPSGIASRRTYLDLRHPGNGASLWQYTERGSHEGIKGNVDVNECWEMERILNLQ